jgi:hypothetical protein
VRRTRPQITLRIASVKAGRLVNWAYEACNVVLDPSADDHLIMGRLLCRIGVHRWVNKRNPEGGAHYLECERCQKQKDTITLGGSSGGGFWG